MNLNPVGATLKKTQEWPPKLPPKILVLVYLSNKMVIAMDGDVDYENRGKCYNSRVILIKDACVHHKVHTQK